MSLFSNKQELSLTRVNEQGELQTFEHERWWTVDGYFAYDDSIKKVQKAWRGNLHLCENLHCFIFILKKSLI